ncbi:acyltransferase family protein [Kangiella sp. TOML190]|uniref:acyltransferase family protein n=1 Tax=Kangiella sp. TOML190 TaxID=2931351 RepID=UPI002042485B|nr:acyltransferase family protein [Kangiella sp. TOML190]
MNRTPQIIRRYDLDWLRVIAFILLIFYHVGMMYVSWGWHIKSTYISSNLEYLMLMLNQWRIPLLFFVSGCAIFFASTRYHDRQLLKLRVQRLLLPIIFGILVIVPPQLYFEMLYDGALSAKTTNYLEFYWQYLDKNSELFRGYETPLWGHMTWNHMWFVVYLLFFSIFFYGMKKLPLSSFSERAYSIIFPADRLKLLLIPCLPFLLLGLVLREPFPSTYAFYNDWYNNLFFFTFFIYGYWLAKNNSIWQLTDQHRRYFLSVALSCYTLLMLMNTLPDDVTWIPEWVESIIDRIILYIRYINTWAWILMLCGFAHHYLNKNSRYLRYLNEAVFPYYILHQTITIVIGYPLTQLGLGRIIEPSLIIIGTFLLSALGFEIVKRINILRPWFGLKKSSINSQN